MNRQRGPQLPAPGAQAFLPEPGIGSTRGDQLVVASARGDPAIVKNEDLVGVQHRRKSMCDNDNGAIAGQFTEWRPPRRPR